MATPKLIPGAAYTVPELSLALQSNTKIFDGPPTFATGDVKWSADGVLIGNVTNLPTAVSGLTKQFTFTFTAAETAQITNRYSLTLSDADSEWCDLTVSEFIGYPDSVQSGVATAGGASTITIARALGADSLPNGCRIDIVGGTGVGQSRVITGYVNSTKVVTVGRAWTTVPDATSQYVISFADLPQVGATGAITNVTNLTNGINPTTGNLIVPAVGDVRSGVHYG